MPPEKEYWTSIEFILLRWIESNLKSPGNYKIRNPTIGWKKGKGETE